MSNLSQSMANWLTRQRALSLEPSRDNSAGSALTPKEASPGEWLDNQPIPSPFFRYRAFTPGKGIAPTGELTASPGLTAPDPATFYAMAAEAIAGELSPRSQMSTAASYTETPLRLGSPRSSSSSAEVAAPAVFQGDSNSSRQSSTGPSVYLFGRSFNLPPQFSIQPKVSSDSFLGQFAGGQGFFQPILASLTRRNRKSAPFDLLRLSRDGNSFEFNPNAAEALGFYELGQNPAVSSDGSSVAFMGDRGQGPGVFLSYRVSDQDGQSFREPLRIAGENGRANGQVRPELGYDSAGDPLFFQGFDLNSRLAITSFHQGEAGLQDDSLRITFKATPSDSSIANSAIPGFQPLLFSDQPGLWQARVDFSNAADAHQPLTPRLSSALPVVQRGDRLGEAIVQGIEVYGPEGLPLPFQDDAAALGHSVAFLAQTTMGDRLVQASNPDSDQDGLLDHWESQGIDIDRDGQRDLDLAAMGADPQRKDIFLEVDWLAPRKSGSQVFWRNEPSPGVMQRLVEMFASAPVTNPDGSKGITLHVDAGPGNAADQKPFSINMGEATLRGGDEVGQPQDPEQHLDIVYFGEPNSLSLEGLETRSFQDIKEHFFSTKDKRARELIFRYLLLADFHSLMRDSQNNPFVATVADSTRTTLTTLQTFGSTDLAGQVVKITAGAGAGQIRTITRNTPSQITVSAPWITPPDATSQFALISSSSGIAEGGFLAPSHSNGQYNQSIGALPGNDLLVTLGGFGVTEGRLGNSFLQWRTIAHELGHTFGLRHGGNDYTPDKLPDLYQSLMSYSHQVAAASTVHSYAGPEDPTFNDWGHLKLDFQNQLVHLANTLGRGAAVTEQEQTTIVLELFVDGSAQQDPIDPSPSRDFITNPLTAPNPLSPEMQAPEEPRASHITVQFSVTDLEISGLQLLLDIDGDREADVVTETFSFDPASVDSVAIVLTGDDRFVTLEAGVELSVSVKPEQTADAHGATDAPIAGEEAANVVQAEEVALSLSPPSLQVGPARLATDDNQLVAQPLAPQPLSPDSHVNGGEEQSDRLAQTSDIVIEFTQVSAPITALASFWVTDGLSHNIQTAQATAPLTIDWADNHGVGQSHGLKNENAHGNDLLLLSWTSVLASYPSPLT